MLAPEPAPADWAGHFDAIRERMRAGGAGPGVARRDQVLDLSGLELMQGILDGTLPYPPIAETLDFGLVEVSRGRAVFQGTPQRRHYNPLGTVHGGWYATLLDSALGCAVHTMLDAGQAYTTAELGVHLVRAATEHTGALRAIGEVVHCGRQLATAQARIVDSRGKLYAHGSTTCLVFEPRRH